jgi:hypothetical protein
MRVFTQHAQVGLVAVRVLLRHAFRAKMFVCLTYLFKVFIRFPVLK